MTTTTAPARPAADSPRRTGEARAGRRPVTGLLFVAPFLLVFAVFLVWPTVAGLVATFYNGSLAGGAGEFLGLGNWREVLDDPAVWTSLRNTALFTVLSVPPLVLLGLGMALLAHRSRRLGWFLRFSFFAPFVLPATVVSLIWVWLYQPDLGLLNGYVTQLGGSAVPWLSSTDLAMVSVVVTTVWWTVGFNFLLYLAALQQIPKELYEAAELDAATPFQQLRHVTLPQLRATTGLIVVLQLLSSLRVFDQIYLMTIGGPNFVTRPILQYVYEQGFTSFRTGYASAVSYVLFAIILIVAVFQLRLTNRGQKVS